jgi:hypothetical protein
LWRSFPKQYGFASEYFSSDIQGKVDQRSKWRRCSGDSRKRELGFALEPSHTFGIASERLRKNL